MTLPNCLHSGYGDTTLVHPAVLGPGSLCPAGLGDGTVVLSIAEGHGWRQVCGQLRKACRISVMPKDVREADAWT
jgi:hypothetical protein